MTSSTLDPKSVKIGCSAQTKLPVELDGQEMTFDARAYEGKDPASQALVLINRLKHSDQETAPLVRIHSGCVTGDIFHSLRCDCFHQLQRALKRIAAEPIGLLIYLPYHEGRGIGLVNKIRAYALQDQGRDTVDANVELGEPIDARDYTLAAAILKDLDISEIRLLTNNPAKIEALYEQGISIKEQVPLIAKPGTHNQKYLRTKRDRLSHKL